MRSFSELLLILFVTATAICAGCETRGGKDDTLFAGENEAKVEPRLADKMVNAAWSLDLRPVRKGVWMADPDNPIFVEAGQPLEIDMPIEVIDDPKVADLVRRGFRPDGKIMYRYPEKLPDDYPPEFLDYAIDIFPEDVPEGQGVDKGHVILYGHILKPPYRIQVVVVSESEKDIRVLINGIDMRLPEAKEVRRRRRDEERARAAKKSRKKNQLYKPNPRLKYLYNYSSRIQKFMNDTICELLKEVGSVKADEEAVRIVLEKLRNDPRVKSVKQNKRNTKIIEYELNYYPELGEDPPFRSLTVDALGGFCHLGPKSHEVYTPPTLTGRIHGSLMDAYYVLSGLCHNLVSVYFNAASMGIRWQDFDALQSYCKTSPKPDVYLKQVSKIVHGDSWAVFVLANCTRSR